MRHKIEAMCIKYADVIMSAALRLVMEQASDAFSLTDIVDVVVCCWLLQGNSSNISFQRVWSPEQSITSTREPTLHHNRIAVVAKYHASRIL